MYVCVRVAPQVVMKPKTAALMEIPVSKANVSAAALF